LNVLSGFERITIVMHDNPDPDAIATGWAVCTLIEEKLAKPVQLLGGGAIVRAENRHMVDLLMPPIELVSHLDAGGDKTAMILVDCGIGTTNHLATRSGITPVGVIDHHLNSRGGSNLPFTDIRPDAAASASIAASYLREQGVEPGVKLATAILYALRTETSGNDTKLSPLDDSVVRWLTDLADPILLAEIENAPLERAYFGDLVLAMQRTFVYDDAAICFLPRATGAEIVGEVADLLVRCRGIRRVLCAAIIGGDLVLSTRTERESGNAAELLQATLDGIGGCGGHTHRAGGKVPDIGKDNKSIEDLYDDLRSRWLKACAVDRQRGTRLIARREIIDNL
jgi:nanoRNase/pAp phosphatase (c-di-AMP/oligoRNAs hydrolase)